MDMAAKGDARTDDQRRECESLFCASEAVELEHKWYRLKEYCARTPGQHSHS